MPCSLWFRVHLGKCADKMVDQGIHILAIGVHPDDVELSCGGTVIKHIELGYRVGMLDLTRGELGTRGNAELRLKEAEDARALVGAEFRENLSLEDGFFVNDKESKIALIKRIRHHRPKIVLANSITDRHPDHGRAAKFVSEACYLSGLAKIETEVDGVLQEKWRPDQVYHYIQDHHIKPDLVIDISGYLERKFEMIACFKSQFYDPNSEEDNTPISSKEFLDMLEGRAVDFGRRIGVVHGEGFTSDKYVGAAHFFDLI